LNYSALSGEDAADVNLITDEAARGHWCNARVTVASMTSRSGDFSTALLQGA